MDYERAWRELYDWVRESATLARRNADEREAENGEFDGLDRGRQDALYDVLGMMDAFKKEKDPTIADLRARVRAQQESIAAQDVAYEKAKEEIARLREALKNSRRYAANLHRVIGHAIEILDGTVSYPDEEE